jgi:hypothetical protein
LVGAPNDAAAIRLMLRPQGLLAPLDQPTTTPKGRATGHLYFRAFTLTGRPPNAPDITTWAIGQLPGRDSHPLDRCCYGLHRKTGLAHRPIRRTPAQNKASAEAWDTTTRLVGGARGPASPGPCESRWSSKSVSRCSRLLPEAKHHPRPSDPVLADLRVDDGEQAVPRMHRAPRAEHGSDSQGLPRRADAISKDVMSRVPVGASRRRELVGLKVAGALRRMA